MDVALLSSENDEQMDMESDITQVRKLQKSYFDVLGLCCSSEALLVEKILSPIQGIEKVSVIVPTRTVIVLHDNLLISQIQIGKIPNLHYLHM